MTTCVYIFLGIAVGLSVYAVWGVRQNTKTLEALLEIIRNHEEILRIRKKL